MSTATITSKGQITIPKAIRDALGLKPNQKVVFVIDEGGKAFLFPIPDKSVDELRGALAGGPAYPGLEKERAAARAAAVKHALKQR